MTVDELKQKLTGDFLMKFTTLTNEEQIYVAQAGGIIEARVRISLVDSLNNGEDDEEFEDDEEDEYEH